MPYIYERGKTNEYQFVETQGSFDVRTRAGLQWEKETDGEVDSPQYIKKR